MNEEKHLSELLGGDSKFLKLAKRGDKNIVIGIINPPPEDGSSPTTFYTKDDMKNLVKNFNSGKHHVPLYIEHDTGVNKQEWGKAVFLQQNPERQ